MKSFFKEPNTLDDPIFSREELQNSMIPKEISDKVHDSEYLEQDEEYDEEIDDSFEIPRVSVT